VGRNQPSKRGDKKIALKKRIKRNKVTKQKQKEVFTPHTILVRTPTTLKKKNKSKGGVLRKTQGKKSAKQKSKSQIRKIWATNGSCNREGSVSTAVIFFTSGERKRNGVGEKTTLGEGISEEGKG